MNTDRDDLRTLGGISVRMSYVLALASVVLGVIAVAFYAHGSRTVAGVLALVAVAGAVPYMRYRQRRGKPRSAV